jgi:hypothetical protein
MPLPDLRCIIAADCPHMVAGQMYDVCGVYFLGSRPRFVT